MYEQNMEGTELVQFSPSPAPSSPNALSRAPSMPLPPLVESPSPQHSRSPLSTLDPQDPLSYLQLKTFRPPLPLPPSQRGLRRHRPIPPPPPPTERKCLKGCTYILLALLVLTALVLLNVSVYNANPTLYLGLIPAQIMTLTVLFIILWFITIIKMAERPNRQVVDKNVESSNV